MAKNTSYFVGLVLFMTFLLSAAMTPTKMIADDRPEIDLEAMIPKELGDWKMVGAGSMMLVSPDVQAKLDLIYNQTLSRTYINEKGEQIMLAIAYGGDQSDSMQVHKPEVCYPAQGFNIVNEAIGSISMPFGNMPVKKLVAQQGQRIEPITYWITVGDEIVLGGLDRKFAQLRYGLTGSIPDGMLVRMSSISSDPSTAYRSHSQFVNRMYLAVEKNSTIRVFGKKASS